MTTAIIGYGKMGKIYNSLLHSKYIVDILPVSHGMYFNKLEEFIRYGATVDLAIVATPTTLHFECSKMLLLHGYNVLCEKPACFSSSDARKLETLAKEKKLLFYQSTLERYNPVIKYFKKNIALSEIDHITSYRFGKQPSWDYECDPLYDLGIHDVDLWFYLTNKKISWKLYCGYGNQRREITVYLKRKGKIALDLLNKAVYIDG
ncbi:MAG: Gfo/Idh/MocA family oxidoreductase, partial [Candidatus Gottesmanbacteria bacterium]|nr:Gfo/Idh/MocA family oxidoreductase [Candidatus Gottesmanbacteria bacterium]